MEGKDLNRLKVVLAEKGGTARLPSEGRGLARSHRFAGGGRTEGIRIRAGTIL